MTQIPNTQLNVGYTFSTTLPVSAADSKTQMSPNQSLACDRHSYLQNSSAATPAGDKCEWESTDFVQALSENSAKRETLVDASAREIQSRNTRPDYSTLSDRHSPPPTIQLGGLNHQQTTIRMKVQRPDSTSIWGMKFSRLDMPQAIDLADQVIQARRPEFFITANLNYLMLVDHHPRLAEVNEHCLCMLADGMPIVLRSRLAEQELPCRVAGSDMIIELARLAANKGYRIFFLGGAPGVAQAAANNLLNRFPKLQVAGVQSPPFRALSQREELDLIQTIRASKPDILLVAYGQPKGELWIYDHHVELGVPLSIQIGASFDFLAGTARRAPRFWQAIGCEWLYRACSDPKRLVPRYVRNAVFLGRLLLWDIKQWIERKAGKPVFEPFERFLIQLKQLDQQYDENK